MRRTALVVAALALTIPAHAQVSPASADTLLDVVVWGTYAVRAVDPAAYPADVRAGLTMLLARANAYTSTRPVPRGGELRMVHSAQVAYERRLVAVTADRSAAALAAAYVDALRPCYEWEGFADCPEREARFADRYLAATPDSPFAPLLPLLSAHRWLCAAQDYDYEKKPDEAARARREFAARLAIARQSSSVLMRTAAAGLDARRTCRAGDGGRAPG